MPKHRQGSAPHPRVGLLARVRLGAPHIQADEGRAGLVTRKLRGASVEDFGLRAGGGEEALQGGAHRVQIERLADHQAAGGRGEFP